MLLTQLLEISGMPLDQLSVPQPRGLLYVSYLVGECVQLLPLTASLPLHLSQMLCTLLLQLSRVLLPCECQLLLVLSFYVVEGPLEFLLLRSKLNLIPVLLSLVVELDLGPLQFEFFEPQVVQLVVNRIQGLSRWPLHHGEPTCQGSAAT